jgi:hypothetical protein
MNAGDMNEPLMKQLQRLAAASVKREQAKSGNALIFRCNKAGRWIATGHDQRPNRIRSARAPRFTSVQNAIVWQHAGDRYLCRKPKNATTNTGAPETAPVARGRPGPYFLSGFSILDAKKLFHGGIEGARKSQCRCDGRHEAMYFDSAYGGARDSSTPGELVLGPAALHSARFQPICYLSWGWHFYITSLT